MTAKVTFLIEMENNQSLEEWLKNKLKKKT
jgi:hypothetical protein